MNTKSFTTCKQEFDTKYGNAIEFALLVLVCKAPCGEAFASACLAPACTRLNEYPGVNIINNIPRPVLDK